MSWSMTGTTRRSGEQACTALSNFKNLLTHQSRATSPSPPLPRTSIDSLSSSNDKTILYLAYGSNLSAETFRGSRGINPLSAVNVHVPTLDLTFDLAGIPYIEPCFANSRYRTPPPKSNEYHKDAWHKGLIGVVYEVTPSDYRTIIATEGGGASYQDILVDCYVLPPGTKTVDPTPTGAPFKAHTLLSPHDPSSPGRISRPDPSYAQASARYLKLITDGAEEHSLPVEYMAYLYSLRPYRKTTYRQNVGGALFLAFWGPIILFLVGISKSVADEDGRIPAWLVNALGIVFRGVWGSYDRVWKGLFGDGERTIGDERDEGDEERGLRLGEKGVRLE